MLFRETFLACPSCGCHFKRDEPQCPHCDAVVELRQGRVPPTAVALLLGLSAAFPLGSGCSEEGDTWGAGGSATSNYAVSDYGTATTGDYGGSFATTTATTHATTSNGAGGGSGGAGGQGGAGGCGSVAAIEPTCEACLITSCCDDLSACEGDPSCLSCLDGDAASCGNTFVTLLLCAHGGCDAACAGPALTDCMPPSPAPSQGACVDPQAACNPVTNAGCDGQACRPSVDGPTCTAVSETAVCSPCLVDVECPASTVCVFDGLIPYLGHCSPLCCDDTDCSVGACVPLDASSSLGTCVAP